MTTSDEMLERSKRIIERVIMDGVEKLIAECLSDELRELRRLQEKRTAKLNRRWWPGQMLLINFRILRAAKRVNLMRLWMG